MANFNQDRITYFGETDYRNKKTKFGIKAIDRTKHMYVIGKTGMGKSTCLENMAVQDIANGEGFAFIDPHGSTAEMLLNYIPEHRIKDVLYFAPFDMEFPVSFNVMEDVGEDKRHLVANGLMSAFKKIWVDAWSARMEYILNNTILALLEYPDSTLLSINRMLSDKEYRKKVVDNTTDTAVKAFWEQEFANYTERMAAEATPAIQNKVGQFISNPIIRNIIGQPKSTFDLRKMMDERKIVIINLSKGQVGEANANLLGSMLITKIYLAAMSRADLPKDELNKLANFYLYVDEFQSFANESFADILSEARKYKLNLTVAHQYVEQMTEEVRAAIFGNVGTMIVFRVGSYDAEIFEREFAPEFTAEDIVNLGKYQMYLRLMVDGVGTHPFSGRGLPPIPPLEQSYRDVVIGTSRRMYGRPRALVEEDINKDYIATQAAMQKKGSPHKNNKGKKPFNNTGGGTHQKNEGPNMALRDALKGMTPESTNDPKQPSQSDQSNHNFKQQQQQQNTSRTKDNQQHGRTNNEGDPQKKQHNQKPKPKKKDGKGPSPESVAALKDALQKAGVQADTAKRPSQQQPQHNESTARPTESPRKQNEVPEHILRKMLEMDANEN